MHHLPARLAPMMALNSDALKTCMCALETSEPSCLDRPAMFFFMLEARNPQGIAGCVAALEPSRHGGRVRSRWSRGGSGALPSREAGSRAMVHVAAPEPSLAGRWGSKPLDTWQGRSPTWQGGRVSAAGHMAVRGWTPHSLS
jgi:hypothetical protein